MKAFLVPTALLLSACSQLPFDTGPQQDSAAVTTAPRPEARPEAPAPAAGARTADQFDTASAEDRSAASAAPSVQGEMLGSTVASLGDPSQPGFRLETPLVSAPATGRVLHPGTNKWARVDLRPIDGPASGGSRISLSAMRVLGADLTDLPTVEVYAGG